MRSAPSLQDDLRWCGLALLLVIAALNDGCPGGSGAGGAGAAAPDGGAPAGGNLPHQVKLGAADRRCRIHVDGRSVFKREIEGDVMGPDGKMQHRRGQEIVTCTASVSVAGVLNGDVSEDLDVFTFTADPQEMGQASLTQETFNGLLGMATQRTDFRPTGKFDGQMMFMSTGPGGALRPSGVVNAYASWTGNQYNLDGSVFKVEVADSAYQVGPFGGELFNMQKNLPSGLNLSRTAMKDGFVSGRPFGATGSGHYQYENDGGSYETSVSISFVVGEGPPTDAQLVITIPGYEDWLPEGPIGDRKTGNGLAIVAQVRPTKRDTLDPIEAPKKITFSLAERSREKGWCLNQPFDGDGDPDLRFMNDGATFDGAVFEVKTQGTPTANAVIASRDWGAWGTVVVTAELENGLVIRGHLEGDDKLERIPVPKRTGDSKIADAWKKQCDGAGVADDADDDKEADNARDGDGLTFYEEYRGLQAKKEHVRLKPRLKELVVEDAYGQEGALDDGFALFEKASGIHVVPLAKGELVEDRRVNLNSTTSLRQHGLRIVGKPFADDTPTAPGRVGAAAGGAGGAGVGGAVGAAGHGGRTITAGEDVDAKGGSNVKSPGDCDQVIMNIDHAGYVAEMGEHEWASSVAHELAHGLGVRHHGDNTVDEELYRRMLRTEEARGEIIELDGSIAPVKSSDANELGNFANTDKSQGCGDTTCIMCYTNFYEFAFENGSVLKFHKLPPARSGDRFCRDGKGTGNNAPSNKKKNNLGDAPKGTNCLAALQLRDPK